MSLFRHVILACLTVATLSTNIEFIQNPGRCKYSNQRCVVISNCSSILLGARGRRPEVCGFSRRHVKVCCDVPEPVTTSTTTITTPSPLPQRCGEVRAVNASTAPSADQTVRRRRSAPSEGTSTQPPTPPVPLEAQLIVIDIDIEPDSIVGGTDVKLAEFAPVISAVTGEKLTEGGAGHRWPWIVLFGRWTEAGLGNWFCGGVLITDRHVLTAAHCLRSEEAASVGVRIGDLNLTISSEVEHQERNVSTVTRHPQYRGGQNDLAVVRLEAPAELSAAVQPICLPPPGAEHPDQDVEVAGWGLLEFGGDASDILQEAELRVADPAACEEAYRRVPQFETRFPGGFQGTKVCAGSRTGEPRDACRGDSGGPLMALQDGSYQLVGVVSTGVGCGNPEFPGLYTKVSAYIDWIVSLLT